MICRFQFFKFIAEQVKLTLKKNARNKFLHLWVNFLNPKAKCLATTRTDDFCVFIFKTDQGYHMHNVSSADLKFLR